MPQLKTRVIIKQGELEGTSEELPSRGSYASFKGIPYAKPPIGNLRFRAPEPAESWQGVRDAKNHRDTAFHRSSRTHNLQGSEDCLYLNVYSPNVEGCYPVMFYIHGGAFVTGSGDVDKYGPEYLVAQNVVLVTCNYRLEVLGFLCLDNEDVPGNAGLKDQVAALKWVNENISHFGGDPGNVTIFGESAGGASASLHMFSPQTKGLFHKVICLSGVCTNEWSMISADDHLSAAFRLGKLLGCETNDKEKLLHFLRNAPASDLVDVAAKLTTPEQKRQVSNAIFVPVVEKESHTKNPYLTKPIQTLIKEGSFHDVPLIVGYNDGEGAMFMKPGIRSRIDELSTECEKYIPLDISRQHYNDKDKHSEIGKLLKEFYFPEGLAEEDKINGFINIMSDRIFLHKIDGFARAMAIHSKSPVYLYEFSYQSFLNVSGNALLGPGSKITCHGDSKYYIFKPSFIEMEVDLESDVGRAVMRFTRLLTNFAKFGNPTAKLCELIDVHWPRVTEEQRWYAKIGDKVQIGKDPHEANISFWRSIYDKYYNEEI